MKKPLIFIDTNILLDFYRIQGGGPGLELVNQLEHNKERLIISTQIEMEYKKNRQRVIISSLKNLKLPDWTGLSIPAFLSSAQPTLMLRKEKRKLIEQFERIQSRIETLLKKPAKNDPIYKCLQRIFKQNSHYNLKRSNKLRIKIRSLARKRFSLGYPPRKDNDLSIGDAINWEWIVYCANESKQDVIIVSRDSDYGFNYEDEPILNDWLVQEFQERVSKKRKIILTNRIAEAFKLASIYVTPQQIKEEKELVSKLGRNKSPLEQVMEETGSLPEGLSSSEREKWIDRLFKGEIPITMRQYTNLRKSPEFMSELNKRFKNATSKD